MGKRRALLRLGSVAIIGLILYATLALASCSPHATPNSSVLPVSFVDIGPRAAHFTPFFSFGGGKETNVGGGGGGLIADSSGNFFGNTGAGGDPTCASLYIYGGGSGCGFVYELVQTRPETYSLRVLHKFTGPDGAAPHGTLLELNGSLYGTTAVGGRGRDKFCGLGAGAGCGVVFELTPKSSGYSYRVIHYFSGVNGDGADPGTAQPIADAHGDIYGTTLAGGGALKLCPATPATSGGCGTVYKLIPSGSGYIETTIYRFRGLSDGANPAQGLMVVNGNLFGTTKYSDTIHVNCNLDPCGVIYELVPTKRGKYRFVLIHKFMSGRNDGSSANALISGPNGVLYGETRVGGGGNCSKVPGGQGREGCGVLYTLTPTTAGKYAFRLIHRFTKISDGIFPGFRMVLYNGLLYGTTGGGGFVNKAVPICVNLAGCGVLFSIEPSGADYKVLYRFTGKADGAWPLAPLTVLNGSIYGTDKVAGEFGYGTAFRYTP